MQSIRKKLGPLNIEVIAISADSPEELKAHLLKKNLGFPVLADPDLIVIDAFGLRHPKGNPFGGDISRPALVLIDENGKTAFRILTDNWRVRPTPEQILKKIQELPPNTD